MGWREYFLANISEDRLMEARKCRIRATPISWDEVNGANLRQLRGRFRLDPALNVPTNFGNREAMPRQADKPRRLSDAEHRTDGPRGQILVPGVPLLVEADFIHQSFVTNWLSLRGEQTEDFARYLRGGEEFDECILQWLPVPAEFWSGRSSYGKGRGLHSR